MKRLLTLFLGLGATLTLAAAPAAKVDPVAPGYPDWQGLTAKAHVTGRVLTPSDLRHKVTIVVDLAIGEKFEEHMLLASQVASSGRCLVGEVNWEEAELPRNVVSVISLHGARHDAYLEALKPNNKRNKEAASSAQILLTCSTYDAITFTGAPDSGGKLPYVYVMGPTGTEPLFKGALDAAGVKGAQAAIAKGKKEIADWTTKWRPFFGNIAEPKFNTSLAKTLEKGKTAKKAPLDPVAKALLADVKSSDAEKAKEAQVLYDAINQTRSDLVYRIGLEAAACPHRAYYDIQTLLKHWPTETKSLTGLRMIPEAEMLGKMYIRYMELSDKDYICKNATETKKILAEIAKMQKKLEAPKNAPSDKIILQNAASSIDRKLSELAASKFSAK